MNILIVTAHPSKDGHTHAIANTYKEAKESKGHTVQLVDLYNEENMLSYLTFQNIRERPMEKVQGKFQEQVCWANEIVVVHPIWWGSAPAIMKNWSEQTFWPRVAYRYTGPGKVEKMFIGKTAKVFATSGGPSWYFYTYFLPLLPFWKLCVFGFTGVELIDYKICGKMDMLSGDEKTAHFQKFLKKVKKSAISKN